MQTPAGWQRRYDAAGEWIALDRPASAPARRPRNHLQLHGRTLRAMAGDVLCFESTIERDWSGADLRVHAPLPFAPFSTRLRCESLADWACVFAERLADWCGGAGRRLEAATPWIDERARVDGEIDFGGMGHGGLITLRTPDPARVRAWSKVERIPPLLGWWISGLSGAVLLDGHARLAALRARNARWETMLFSAGTRPPPKAEDAATTLLERHADAPPETIAGVQQYVLNAWRIEATRWDGRTRVWPPR